MRYSIERVINQIVHNKKIYGFIITEYAIGITLFVICLNVLFTSNEVLNNFKKSMVEDVIPITYSNVGYSSADNTQFPITYEEYVYLSSEEGYGKKVKISFSLFTVTTFFLKDFNSVENYYIFFMDNNMFKSLVSNDRDVNTCYVGIEPKDSISKILSTYTVEQLEQNMYTDSEWFSIKDNKINLGDKQSYSIEEIEYISDIKTINYPSMYLSDEDKIPMEKCIIFPVEAIDYVQEESLNIKESILNIVFKHGEMDENTSQALVTELSMLHDNYQYSIANQYLVMQRGMMDLNSRYRSLLWVALSLLIIILTGMSGVLIIILHKRIRSMLIAIAYGSTYFRVVLELTLEILTIFIVGGAIGTICSSIVTPYISSFFSNSKFHYICILIVLLISIVESLLVCTLALLGVRQESPISLLKDS